MNKQHVEKLSYWEIADGNGCVVEYMQGKDQEALNAAASAFLVGSARKLDKECWDDCKQALAEHNSAMAASV